MIKIFNDNELFNFYSDKKLWNGCYGGMSIISHDYLKFINEKYDISKLLDLVKTRYNRISFERVIGCLLQFNHKSDNLSLLGNINNYCKWGGSYDWKNNYKHLPIIKIWSGR